MPKVTVVESATKVAGSPLTDFVLGDIIRCVGSPCGASVPGGVYVLDYHGNAVNLGKGSWLARDCDQEWRFEKLDVDEIKLILK